MATPRMALIEAIRGERALKRLRQDLEEYWRLRSAELRFPTPPDLKSQSDALEAAVNGRLPIAIDLAKKLGVNVAVQVPDQAISPTQYATFNIFERALDTNTQYWSVMPRHVRARLDQTIGAVREERIAATWRLFSPIEWLAGLVSLPTQVLRRAGVPEEALSGMWGILLKMAAGAVILLLLSALGLSWVVGDIVRILEAAG